MTPKEVIQKVTALRPADRQPAALLSGGSWALYTNGLNIEKALTMPPEEVADILLNTNISAGVDILWAAPSFGNLLIRSMGGKIKFRAKGPPDVVEALIKEPRDTEKIDVDRCVEDRSLQTMGEITRWMVRKAGNEYPVAGSIWGPFTLAGLLYGVENLMRAVYREKETVRGILDFTAALYLKCADHFYIQNGVDIVSLADPAASGDMISRKHFAEFVVPLYEKIYAELRKKNMITGIHICGNIEDRLDLLAAAGIQFISLDYKVDLKKARSVVGGRAALAGNMNPVEVMLNETAGGVARACQRCIADAGSGGGFILMPGCDIPAATPVENVRAMVETARSCGARFP
ncbi:MAG: uroporphyrinogen decarboxylase [Treponema sp.]|nr:uroporphyrinogen decarboxylase [Treponema sp.]